MSKKSKFSHRTKPESISPMPMGIYFRRDASEKKNVLSSHVLHQIVTDLIDNSF